MKVIKKDECLYIKVRVTPKASKNQVGPIHADSLKVFVTEPPEKGKANGAVIRLIAEALDIPCYNIEITSGFSNRNKEIRIEGIEEKDLEKLGI